MEGFFTPQSHKRTAGLPNPCPVGLRSCCSLTPVSLSLGPCWAPALCWIHALPRSLPLGPSTPQTMLGPSFAWDDRIHTPLGSPPFGLWQAPALHKIHIPQGSLPLRPPTPQALLGPSSTWDDQSHALPGYPPLRSCQILPWRNPCPLGQAPAQHETAASLPCWDAHPSGGAGLQLYSLPDN
jgi:hypothetical protein